METDKRYLFEGLFVIGLAVAAAWFFVWLSKSNERDYVLYRIHFAESVSGLSVGELVKFRGVDVGKVKSMAIDAEDPRRVRVDVALAPDAPVMTDTKASLRLKGITGAVFIELDGGGPEATSLAAATPPGRIPEIESVKSELATVLDRLPEVVDKFSALESQTQKVLKDVGRLTNNLDNESKKILKDVGETTAKIKENPSLLLRRPKEKKAEVPRSAESSPGG